MILEISFNAHLQRKKELRDHLVKQLIQTQKAHERKIRSIEIIQ